MLHIATILATIGVYSVTCDGDQDPNTKEEFLQHVVCEATWEDYVTARDTYLRVLGEKRIRQYRDKLLIETDWIETPYNQSTIANIEEWNTYRQFLRDLPSQIDKLTWIGGRPDFSSLGIPPIPKTIRKPTS